MNNQEKALATKWKWLTSWRWQYKFTLHQFATYGVITHLTKLNAQISCTFIRSDLPNIAYSIGEYVWKPKTQNWEMILWLEWPGKALFILILFVCELGWWIRTCECDANLFYSLFMHGERRDDRRSDCKFVCFVHVHHSRKFFLHFFVDQWCHKLHLFLTIHQLLFSFENVSKIWERRRRIRTPLIEMKLFALYAPHLNIFNMDHFDILLLYAVRGTSYVFENNLQYKLFTANKRKTRRM